MLGKERDMIFCGVTTCKLPMLLQTAFFVLCFYVLPLFLLCMCFSACCSARGNQKGVLDPLETGRMWGEVRTGWCGRATSAHNCSSISPASSPCLCEQPKRNSSAHTHRQGLGVKGPAGKRESVSGRRTEKKTNMIRRHYHNETHSYM